MVDVAKEEKEEEEGSPIGSHMCCNTAHGENENCTCLYIHSLVWRGKYMHTGEGNKERKKKADFAKLVVERTQREETE